MTTPDFDNLCLDYEEGSTDLEHLAHIEQSNKVIRLFTTEYVLKNKTALENNERLFHRMIQGYLNIFDYNHNKPNLKDVLRILHIPDDPLGFKILKLSIPGRYLSLSRTNPLANVFAPDARAAFLDAVESFYTPKNHTDNHLYSKLEIFAEEALVGRRTFGPAVLSGLAAALYPKKFMVYNTRSVEILKDYNSYEHLTHLHITKYREFNNLHQAIAKEIKTPLIELDTTVWS